MIILYEFVDILLKDSSQVFICKYSKMWSTGKVSVETMKCQ